MEDYKRKLQYILIRHIGKDTTNQHITLTIESYVASGALQALRNLSSILPTSFKQFNSASMNVLRLKSWRSSDQLINTCLSFDISKDAAKTSQQSAAQIKYLKMTLKGSMHLLLILLPHRPCTNRLTVVHIQCYLDSILLGFLK